MNKSICLLAALPLAFLFGCASPAKMENMVYRPSQQTVYDDALKNQVGIESATGGEKTNPLWTSEISTEAFSEAVKQSLQSEGLFSENGRYQLEITMLKTQQPMFGLNFTVTTTVNYILTDRASGSVLLDEIVSAPYTATVGDAFIAVQRLRLANEGSGKENIKGLLDKLAALKLGSDISVTR